MGQKAVLHSLRLASVLALLVAFWSSPSVAFAKNNTEEAAKTTTAISLSFAVTNVTCNGGANGALTVTASGGTGPYTYQWSNGKTTATITGLTAGFYTVVVMDATGAMATDQKEVQQPTALGSGAAQVQGQLCQFQANGIAQVWGYGGTPPYTYKWSNGQTAIQATGLAFGSYTVTVTDANNCTSASSVTIDNNTAEGIWIMLNNAQVCGGGTATLHAGAMSGVPPYTYQWSPGGQTTQDITVGPGTYTVTIGDQTGCSGVKTATVTSVPGVNATASATNAGCGGSTGSATANASGGSGSYSYKWNTGATSQTITNLAPGTYTVTVSDNNASGCTAVASATVQGGGSGLNVNATVNSNANCANTGGSATASATGGTGSFTYKWNTGATTATISNLGSGTYTVTVTDGAGCTGSASTTVNQTGGPTGSATANSSATCTTGGSATASGSGGTSPYTYKWDNGQTTATATNLAVGTHSVTITDAAGCTATASVNITGSTNPTVSATALTQANCTSGGSASATASGGTTPYSYKWDNGQTTATATNLSIGTHTVTVTDGGGCTATASVNITGSTNAPSVTVSVVSQATCSTGGSATANPSGGTSPYTYKWDNNQTTQTATNLAGGTHTVTVTDAGGCTTTGSVTITVQGAPTASAVVNTNAVCNLGGSATATASGGTPAYTFKWDNNQTTATATNLAPGSHTVTVTDSKGCTATASVTIQATNGSVSLTTTVISNAVCGTGGSASAAASNGTTPYTYKWSNNATTATISNLAPGSYTVTATDANGCTASKSVTITDNPGAKIGDYVWYDDSQNGYQDPAETNGVGGISVKLQTAGADNNFGTADDVTVKSTTTSATGYYLFDCIPPGGYILYFQGLPTGYQWSKKDAANNDCLDSDVNSAGRTDPFTVTAGQPDNLCYDAGIHTACDNVTSPGSICCDQTICEGGTPAQLYNTLLPFGGVGNIEYQWLQLVQIGGAPAQWVPIPGATSVNYQPGPLYQTSSFMRCARREGCVAYLESNIVTVTVKPAGSQGCPTPYISVKGTVVGSTIDVAWVTTPEFIDLVYTLEHSMDKIGWDAIAIVPGQHSSTADNAYRFTDNTPMAGVNYYRVKRTNAQGEVTYSDILEVAMHVDIHHSIKFSPNPVTEASGELTIQNMMQYDKPVTIDFIDPSGKLLHTTTIQPNTTAKKLVDLSGYPSGIFFARIRFGDGAVETVRLSKIVK